jgi:hypothetical protein
MCAWCQFGSTTGQSQPIQSYPKQSNWTFPRIHPGAHQPAVTMAAVCLIPLSLERRGLGIDGSLGEVHGRGRLIYGRPAPLLHCELIFHGASYAYSYARTSGWRPVTGPLPRRSFHRLVGRSVGRWSNVEVCCCCCCYNWRGHCACPRLHDGRTPSHATRVQSVHANNPHAIHYSSPCKVGPVTREKFMTRWMVLAGWRTHATGCLAVPPSVLLHVSSFRPSVYASSGTPFGASPASNNPCARTGNLQAARGEVESFCSRGGQGPLP